MPGLDLEQLLIDFNQGSRISKLEAKLGMPANEIIQIMQELSTEHPETWNPEMVKVYERRAYQRQWYQQHGDERRAYQRQWYQQHGDEGRAYQRRYMLKKEFPELEPVLNLGYGTGRVQLTDGQLRISIDEPTKYLHMEDVLDDFKLAVQQLPYDINLMFGSEPNTVVLSPEQAGKRVEKRSMRLLEALKYAFQARYSG